MPSDILAGIRRALQMGLAPSAPNSVALFPLPYTTARLSSGIYVVLCARPFSAEAVA